ncbi:MAG: hypothetical protein HYZ50_16650 [Deltaproteobacteria bacterium]|nr:hypothetical protein [Deltaproteobacteria bacterium]
MTAWERVQKEFRHAFALTPLPQPLTADERILLEKIARLIAARGMAAPALLFLESLAPLSFLGSQIIHSMKPFLDLVCDPLDLGRLAQVLERRDGVDLLVSQLQEQANSPT